MSQEPTSTANPMQALEERLAELQRLDLPADAAALVKESLELVAEERLEKAALEGGESGRRPQARCRR